MRSCGCQNDFWHPIHNSSAPRAVSTQTTTHRQYQTFNALRGVAALAGVVFHLAQVRLEPAIVPGAYLAVDFFCLLSGFVLAVAYEQALQGRLSLGAFFVKRLIRLYPLALLGAALGLAVLLLKWWTTPAKVDPLPQILVSGVLNGLMLPTFFGGAISRFGTFPGNGPLWTLSFELVANLAWAWVGVRMRTAALAVVTVISGAILIVVVTSFHTANLGFDDKTFLGGLARESFSFPLGVIIYRLRHRLSVGHIPYAPLLLGAALCAIFLCPWGARANGVPWRDLVCITTLLPIIVILGIGHSGTSRLGSALGTLSYPIYALHYPLLEIASALHQTALRHVNVQVLAGSAFALIIGSATLATRCYDEPVRRWLSQKVRSMRADSDRGLSASELINRWPPHS